MPISRRQLTLAVAERAAGVTNATGYLGKVGALYGLPGVTSTPDDPPTKSATDLRVKPYYVLFPSAGTPDTDDGGERSAAGPYDEFVDLDWPVQITAVAGDLQDLLALVDRVHARFYRWTPSGLPDGVRCGPFGVPDGWNPGVLTDTQFTPHRLYLPLRYQLTAHT